MSEYNSADLTHYQRSRDAILNRIEQKIIMKMMKRD